MHAPIVLAAPGAVARIDAARGGRLASLEVQGHELLVTGAGAAIDWGCYPMVPWAGRIRRGLLRWDGAVHALPATLPPHAIHGTVFDRPWRASQASATRTRLHVDLGPDWPWPGEARSQIALDARGLTWRIEVHALRDPMPVTVGWHPWFRRRLDRGGPVGITLPARRMYLRDEEGIPTGATVPPPPGPWDDCFTELDGAPALTWPGALRLELASDCEHVVVFDEREHAVCVEPQSGPPDAANLGLAQVAAPGRPVVRRMRLAWHAPG